MQKGACYESIPPPILLSIENKYSFAATAKQRKNDGERRTIHTELYIECVYNDASTPPPFRDARCPKETLDRPKRHTICI